MVSFTDRAATPANVLVRILDRESVLLNLETEQYFGLDETGTRMWQLVTGLPNIEAAYQDDARGVRCRAGIAPLPPDGTFNPARGQRLAPCNPC